MAVSLALFALYGLWWSLQSRGLWEFGYEAVYPPEPLPYTPVRGFTYEQLWNHVTRFALLTPALLLLAVQLLGGARAGEPPRRRQLAKIAIAASTLLCAAILLVVTRGRPFCDDEHVYAMQARFLIEGRIADARLGFSPPEGFVIPTPSGYTGKYLPGEPVTQMLGVLVGMPALLHVPLLLGTLLLWQRTLVARSGKDFADMAVVALAISPMLILTSATGLSHVSALFGIVLLGYGLTRCENGAPTWGAAMAALGAGYALFCRPQSALPAALVLVPLAILALWKARSLSGLLVLGLTGGLITAMLLLYNYRVTGHPLRLPWFQQCGPEHYGFGRVWKASTYSHTFRTALENLGVVAVRLNAWWLGLPASLLVLLAWLWHGRSVHGQSRWLWVGLAIILFEFFYFSTGVSDTGAIYHFELLLPGSIVAASVAQRILARWGRRGAFAMGGVLLLGSGSFMIEQVLRLNRLMAMIHTDSDWALASVKKPALLISETWGTERRNVGWVMDSFPRRFRGQNDDVVTFPRLSPALLDRVRNVYPHRNCYYYHRRPDTEVAELLRCEEAQTYLTRGARPNGENWRSLWIVPTAYKKTDDNPAIAREKHRIRSKEGNVLVPCCALEELQSQGTASITIEPGRTCIPDGPSPKSPGSF